MQTSRETIYLKTLATTFVVWSTKRNLSLVGLVPSQNNVNSITCITRESPKKLSGNVDDFGLLNIRRFCYAKP